MRCEDVWPYISSNWRNEECKNTFEAFLRGLFGMEDEDITIGSPRSLIEGIRLKNWRAIELLLGSKGTFADGTFPLPFEEVLCDKWQGR